MGGTNTMDEKSVITILENLCKNTSINWLGLLMPIPLHIQGSHMHAEYDRIEKKLDKIKTEIAKIRETCNKKMLTLNLMGATSKLWSSSLASCIPAVQPTAREGSK